MTLNDRLTAALTAISELGRRRIVAATTHGGNEGAVSLITKEMEACKAAIRANAFVYDTANPAAIGELARPSMVGQVARIQGWVSQMQKVRTYAVHREKSTLVELIGGAADTNQLADLTADGLVTSATLMNASGDQIETADFFDRHLIERLQSIGHRTANWEFLVLVTTDTPPERLRSQAISSGDRSVEACFIVMLLDARPLTSPLQVTQATPGEIEVARQLYSNRTDMVALATQTISTYLNLSANVMPTLQQEAISFQVIANAMNTPRGHAILVGPSGCGKSTAGKAAEILAPTHQRLDAAKFSEAGLVGDARSSRNHRMPGIVPRAHTGALIIEDIHQMNQVKNGHFTSILSPVMECGRVVDGTISRQEYRAEVGLVLDSNRKTEVRRKRSNKDGLDRFIEDTGMAVNMLTRATYIAEWPRDLSQAMALTTSIMRENANGRPSTEPALVQTIRHLKVFMAWIRETYREVFFSPELLSAATQAYMEAINCSADITDREPGYQDFLARGSVHWMEMIRAHARLCCRDHVIQADIDAVFPFLLRKFWTIRTIIMSGDLSDTDARAAMPGRRRLISIHVQLKKRNSITVQEVKASLKFPATPDTAIYDDLVTLFGLPNASGVFSTRA